ncbi:MAG: Fic family protein [Nanoarchaeota archaeon]|nr:Fic family protein [DPANN group archaeon]MBL7116875.1 Fic family protein [Nanoarchaeota archaeon]
MVSIVTKKIKGLEYLYLVDSIRKKEKVIQKTIKYIGRKRPIPKEEFECMKYSYKKEDWILTDKKDELSYQKHEEMKVLSDKRKEYLNRLDEVSREKEQEKFLSRFIANSNEIEGSTLTSGETFNYLFNDVAPKGHKKKELFMATNMLKAWNYVEEHKNSLPTKEDLLTLHELVNRDIESDETLGEYKKVQNYAGEENTTSFLFVKERMKQLLSWIRQAFRNMDDFEVAFQSHAQFEIIHPFVDGNGRVGRLLLNWLLMNKHLMPFAIRAVQKPEYIFALNNSKRGKKEAISKFCYKEYISQYRFI